MSDEHTTELLSRYLDGDLEATEAEALTTRLQREPALRFELEELQELQQAIRQQAAAMTAPPELDALLEPLRRSRPPRRLWRPAYQVLAAAAVVVVGLIVGLEVAQRGPQQETPAPSSKGSIRNSLGSREPFQLRPLPTPSDKGDEAVGVAEHLLTTPSAEPEVEEPKPLTIIGPLNSDERQAFTGEGIPDDADAVSEQRATADGDAAPAPAEVEEAAKEARTRRAPASERTVAQGARAQLEAAPAVPSAPAQIEIAGKILACARCRGLAAGSGVFSVAVEAEHIVSCQSETSGGAWHEEACGALLGMAVVGVNDGEHRVRLEVAAADGDD